VNNASIVLCFNFIKQYVYKIESIRTNYQINYSLFLRSIEDCISRIETDHVVAASWTSMILHHVGKRFSTSRQLFWQINAFKGLFENIFQQSIIHALYGWWYTAARLSVVLLLEEKEKNMNASIDNERTSADVLITFLCINYISVSILLYLVCSCVVISKYKYQWTRNSLFFNTHQFF